MDFLLLFFYYYPLQWIFLHVILKCEALATDTDTILTHCICSADLPAPPFPGTQSRTRLQLPLLSFSSTSNSRDNLKQFSRRQNCVPSQNLSGELTGWVKVGLVEDAGSKLKTHLMKPLLLRRQAELEDRG